MPALLDLWYSVYNNNNYLEESKGIFCRLQWIWFRYFG